MTYISDIIDVNKLRTDRFNLVVSGCGTGKTYFIKHHLCKALGLKRTDIIFATSRASIVEQQVADAEGMSNFAMSNRSLINYWNGDGRGLAEDEISCMSYSKLIAILDDFPGWYGENLKNVKVLVIDECHAMFSDGFIENIALLRARVRDFVSREGTIVIGLTATPGIVESNWGSTFPRINYVLDEPLIAYKAKNLWLVDKEDLPALLADKDTFPGKSFVLSRSVKECLDAAKASPNTACVVSKQNEAYSEDTMGPILRKIVEEETVPECIGLSKRKFKLRTLYTTTTLREGINLREESGIRNVVCNFYDDLHIAQFLGRCRYDIDNLVIVIQSSTYRGVKPGDNNRRYISNQAYEFYRYIRHGEPQWLDRLTNYVETNEEGEIIPKRYPRDAQPRDFASWFDENFDTTSESPQKIYSEADKKLIVKMARKYRLIPGRKCSTYSYTVVFRHLRENGIYDIVDGRCLINREQVRYKQFRKGGDAAQ